MRKLCPLVARLRVPIANQEVATAEKGGGRDRTARSTHAPCGRAPIGGAGCN